jgi:hypothetical protein
MMVMWWNCGSKPEAINPTGNFVSAFGQKTMGTARSD